jgi:N-acetylmuramoyl-L-alanine amidase
MLSKDSRRQLAVTVIGDQEFVSLDDLAGIFQLTIREDSLGAITVSYKSSTIVLTPDQALASVAGRLISLPAAPIRSGPPAAGRPARWLVPVEFIARALAAIYDSRLDLRKASHLLVVGELRVPRVAMRFESQPASARVTIDATPRTSATVSQENERLTVRFDADALDPSLQAVPAQGLVQAIHVADATTIAIDLGPRFATFRASTQAADNSSRTIIDLVAAQTETPAPAPPSPPPPPPDLAVQSPTLRTVAIDPGHGGEDQGVVGERGTKEKDVTLAVARRLKTAIEARLGIRVLLTRDEDRNVPVDERTSVANNNKADVFVSLHAGASLRPRTAGGSIFYAAFDQNAADAGRQSEADRLPTFGGGTRDIELVPWNLAQTRHADRSAQLARIVEQQLRGHVPLGAHSVERAPLRVLESANMPAVLVEMGYLSNTDQERQLTGNEFQGALVQALVDAILRFREYVGGLT